MSETDMPSTTKVPPCTRSIRNALLYGLRATAMSVLFALGVGWPAAAQAPGRITIVGTVSSPEGGPLPGVTVSVQGMDARAVTGGNGRFLIPNAPPDGILRFAIVGRRSVETSISGRTRIDISMPRIAYLEEVLVTSYAEQRRADITGAVTSVPIEAINRETGASVLQKLAAITPGVTVEASGSPGSRSTVRIRGISSFQNNDPLYIVDGTPVQDSYINWLNPEDITSVQVLKDAPPAAISGSRPPNRLAVTATTEEGFDVTAPQN